MTKQFAGKLKVAVKRLEAKLRGFKFSKEKKLQRTAKESQTSLETPLSFAYKLFGDKSARVLPLFKDLDQSLQKSGLKVNFKAYVSLTVVSSFVIALPVAIATTIVLFFFFNMALSSALLFGVGT